MTVPENAFCAEKDAVVNFVLDVRQRKTKGLNQLKFFVNGVRRHLFQNAKIEGFVQQVAEFMPFTEGMGGYQAHTKK
jgi:hypothetical protein